MKSKKILFSLVILCIFSFSVSQIYGQNKKKFPFGGKDINTQTQFAKKYQNEIEDFARDYMNFLGTCKTSRECVSYFEKEVKRAGFQDWVNFYKDGKKPKPGDRFYLNNRYKDMVLFIIGEKPLASGIQHMYSHIDANHIYFKARPIYEKFGFALAQTKIYGGIKNYLWLSQPLALHGVVYTKAGKKVDIVIGENENDPVFVIPDLLIHKDRWQLGGSNVKSEQMDPILAYIQTAEKSVKEFVLTYLLDHYGITEEDFISAEIEIVPAEKPREVGLDRTLIGGFGQDDKICSFVQYRAIKDIKIPKHTCFVDLSDKEEVGWGGTTGVNTYKLEQLIGQINERVSGQANENIVREALDNGYSLDADVTCAVNPLFPQPHELENAAALGFGSILGQGGDHAEFWWGLRDLLNRSGSLWQTGDFGKAMTATEEYAVPPGQTGMDHQYFGMPLLSMHSLFELSHKVDLYSSYQTYKFFLEDELTKK